jgi:hypothetical protein
MSYASKADIDVVKHAITAPTLTRRPMYSNGTDFVPQRATMIGAANKAELADLLRDPSGMRRFLDVHVRARPDWAAAEDVDWRAIWSAVDQAAEDPMLPFAEQVRERQEAARERTNAELWCETLGPRSLNGSLGAGSRIPAMALFRAFRDWEEEAFPKAATSIVRFGRDLAAMDPPAFEKVRTARGNEYRWTGGADEAAAAATAPGPRDRPPSGGPLRMLVQRWPKRHDLHGW